METIITSAFCIYGVRAVIEKLYHTFTYKELNWFGAEIRRKNRLLYYALMPIIFCRTCMSSFWGSIFFFFWSTHEKGVPIESLLMDWPYSIVAIAGVVYFMTRLER